MTDEGFPTLVTFVSLVVVMDPEVKPVEKKKKRRLRVVRQEGAWPLPRQEPWVSPRSLTPTPKSRPPAPLLSFKEALQPLRQLTPPLGDTPSWCSPPSATSLNLPSIQSLSAWWVRSGTARADVSAGGPRIRSVGRTPMGLRTPPGTEGALPGG